jgi:hypothetical protein
MRKNLLILLAVLFLGFVAFIIFSADNWLDAQIHRQPVQLPERR